MRNLEITKTREYVWCLRNFRQDAGFTHITCWHVIDADTGEMVVGGHRRGSNSQSGKAYIPRKKDAKAFIEGYHAAENGEVSIRDLYRRVQESNWFCEGGLEYLENKKNK